MMAFNCGSCEAQHESAEVGRACHGGAEVAPCHWLVERVPSWVNPEGWVEYAEEPVVVDCAAEAVYDARGFWCVNGHGYVRMEVRAAEGWEYADGDGEAKALAEAGVMPVQVGFGP